MRIFERLRRRSRSNAAIVRKLFEAITGDLLRKLEGETTAPAFTENKANAVPAAQPKKRPLSRAILR
ncbi:hypothetical protein [Bradyrhizobium icense]|uniref:Uncharacterized protein n=1 Tax=Bradyrhizobium icense TaxID=1274631 RepID=A0A1B1UC98_9BRAD|nr:hypothetical protein [Bradyrhizobium icense]ANW00373.1 hypothetical protein LMTR13_09545 [Bradyrhizobium icense]